jgi:sortase A
VRAFGALLATAGLILVAWVGVTLVWEEPVTAALARLDQRQLDSQLRTRALTRPRVHSTDIARIARAYRLGSEDGEALGRIAIPRIGLRDVFVYGTAPRDLARGPGLYPGDFLPGEHRLVYLAGHRTTHGAPFEDLDRLRRGDTIRISLPYGTFRYRVTGHRIVPARAVWVLRSHRREQLILQTCHPRFSASHRYLVYAEPIRRTHAN